MTGAEYLASYAMLHQTDSFLFGGQLQATLKKFLTPEQPVPSISNRSKAGKVIAAIYKEIRLEEDREALWNKIVSSEHSAGRWKEESVRKIFTSLVPCISEEHLDRWVHVLEGAQQAMQQGKQQSALLVNVSGDKGCQKSTGIPCALHVILFGVFPADHSNADLETALREDVPAESRQKVEELLQDCRIDLPLKQYIYVSVLGSSY